MNFDLPELTADNVRVAATVQHNRAGLKGNHFWKTMQIRLWQESTCLLRVCLGEFLPRSD